MKVSQYDFESTSSRIFVANFDRKLLKFLSSLKLAVVVILAIAILSAWGTIVESQYDATTAQKLVYHSWWSFGIFGLLCVVLVAVMVDRWPWKPRHIGFLFAHVGIIVLLMGSMVTKQLGIDGSVRFGIGENRNKVVVPQTDLILYGSLNGSEFIPMSDGNGEVDFIVDPPTADEPYLMRAGQLEVKIFNFIPYALRDIKIIESVEKNDGPAIRFQFQNDRVNMAEWLRVDETAQNAELSLGPAKVIVSRKEMMPSNGNQIILWPSANQLSTQRDSRQDSRLNYALKTERTGEIRRGTIAAGESISTGWMGLEFRMLSYYPKARENITYVPVKRPGPLTTSALEFSFNKKNYFLGLNSVMRLFTDEGAYILSYGNRVIDLGFALKLVDFQVGRYQGTMRAASYESVVEIPLEKDFSGQQLDTLEVAKRKALLEQEFSESGASPDASPHQAMIDKMAGEIPKDKRHVLISMNEPLKYNGFTFYQASFEEGEGGRPVASILSVNYDPGRWIKYLGSLMIVLGTLHLFYFRGRRNKAQAKVQNKAQAQPKPEPQATAKSIAENTLSPQEKLP